MKIQYMAIDDLRQYEKNARKIDKAIDYVMESIKAFGFRVPLVIDKNNTIVSGHVRYAAAKKMGIDVLPCIVADDLNDEQIKAFRLIDNKTQELSTWDFSKLIKELDLIDMDMSALGFYTATTTERREQVLDDSEELDLDFFDDEMFACTCPACGFKFND